MTIIRHLLAAGSCLFLLAVIIANISESRVTARYEARTHLVKRIAEMRRDHVLIKEVNND
jgi:hypothetical protein